MYRTPGIRQLYNITERANPFMTIVRKHPSSYVEAPRKRTNSSLKEVPLEKKKIFYVEPRSSTSEMKSNHPEAAKQKKESPSAKGKQREEPEKSENKIESQFFPCRM